MKVKDAAWEDDWVEAVATVTRTPPNDPCPPETSWVQLISGDVSEEEAERLRAHLAACPDCAETARDAGRFLAAMGELGHVRRVRPAWLASLAALVVLGIGVVVALQVSRPDPLAVWTRGGVTPPPAPSGSVDGELVFRGGEALEQALAPYRAGDWRAAERALGSYLAAHPSDLRAALYRGAALLADGRPAEARAPLEAATRAAVPEVAAEARWYLALACLRAGDRTAAAQALAPLRHREGPRAAEVEALAAALERSR